MSQLRMKVLIISAIIAILAFAALSSSYVIRQEEEDSIQKQNAKDAQALQDKFATFTPETDCVPNEIACINGDFAKCATVATEDGGTEDKYQIQECNTGLTCFVLPLVNSKGTSLVCTTQEDRDARFKQALES